MNTHIQILQEGRVNANHNKHILYLYSHLFKDESHVPEWSKLIIRKKFPFPWQLISFKYWQSIGSVLWRSQARWVNSWAVVVFRFFFISCCSNWILIEKHLVWLNTKCTGGGVTWEDGLYCKRDELQGLILPMLPKWLERV